MSNTLYVVDAVTNDVYSGIPHESLVKHYDSSDKRIAPSPRGLHIGEVQPVLAKGITRDQEVTSEDDGSVSVQPVTTWYMINQDEYGPAPTPGEWRMVHLFGEV